MNSNIKISPAHIVSFASVILIFHYFLSYKWMYGFLEIYDLHLFSIITLEDILFPFGELNYTVIIMSSFGFVWIYLIQFLLTEKQYLNLDDHLAKTTEEFWGKIVTKTKWLLIVIWTRKWWIVSVIIASSIAILITGYFFWPYLKFPESGALKSDYILIIIIIPIIHIVLAKKRTLTMGLYLISIFLWSNRFVDNIILDTKTDKSPGKSATDVKFVYNGEKITTNDSIRFVYRSYKYMILQNRNTGEIQIYPNDKVEVIKYLKKIKITIDKKHRANLQSESSSDSIRSTK